MNVQRSRQGRLPVSTAIVGTVLIAAAAFWLSFTALSDLAHRSGITTAQAWAWPLIVDGLIVVATVAVVALDGHRALWYPWVLLLAATLVSVTANAVHVTVEPHAGIPVVVAGCVAAVPPIVLLASTHLTVVVARTRRAPDTPELSPTDATSGRHTGDRDSNGFFTDQATIPAVGVLTATASGRSDRRLEAVRLRARGLSNRAIAKRLDVHPSTVGRWLPTPNRTGKPPGEDHNDG